mgnify:CR=1 FL=1
MDWIPLLLHTCCAHCAAYTSEYWKSRGFQATLFWYNPNVHPFQEHERRLEAVKSFSQIKNLPLIVEQEYDFVEFFRAVVGQEVERCQKCFQLRLNKTAQTALNKNFPAFSTTLLISPHQKHELIKKIGEEVAKESGLTFLYHDLRRNYSDSRHRTKGLNIYRQQYCGCLYSEWERYSKIKSR